MSRVASVNNLYDTAPLKTPNFKEILPLTASRERPKDAASQHILMDEYGQTPDHYYLAKKPPPSFHQVKRKLEWPTVKSTKVQTPPKTPRTYKTRQRKKINYKQKLTGKVPLDKPRYDTSLGQLTKKFLKLLSDAVDGIINLNTACALLSVPKRRLYDITNVLEGAGLVQKTSRNNIQWKGRLAATPPCPSVVKYNLEKEIDCLEAKENKLDELIYYMKAELDSYKESEEKYHYVTTDDLKNIEEFSQKMIIGVKTSPSVQVFESNEKTVVITSKNTEIEAHLIFDNVSLANLLHEKTPLKENSYQFKIDNRGLADACDGLPKDQTRTGENVNSSECTDDNILEYNQLCTGTIWTEGDTFIKDAFITQEEDIAPIGKHFLLQTEDQNLDLYPLSLLESTVDNYSFSLDDGEGLTDLFDCGFSCP